MNTFDVAYAMKSALWEQIKGNLNALIQLQGSHHGQDETQLNKLADLKIVTTSFINEVEGSELNG